MHEVEVSRTVDASREAVADVLSPAAIVDFAGTYEVRAVEPDGDAVLVTATTEGLETVLVFTESDAGYVYRQRDDRGPFEAMYASVSVTGDRPADLTLRSCFTFGLPLSRLTDWFVARDRKTELERLAAGIAAAVEGD